MTPEQDPFGALPSHTMSPYIILYDPVGNLLCSLAVTCWQLLKNPKPLQTSMYKQKYMCIGVYIHMIPHSYIMHTCVILFLGGGVSLAL